MKLQPNFSWQKYEGEAEDQRQQFQYQLQQEHILVANAVNATVDDLSYYGRERATSWVWIDGKRLYTKTLATGAMPALLITPTTIPLGITGNFTVVRMECCVSNGALAASNTLSLPHIDVVTAANELSIVRNGTNIVITTGGTDRSAYSGYVTIYYTRG